MQPIDLELEKKEILNRYKSLLRACNDKINKTDKTKIRKAFNVAVEAHKDMRRKSDEPYIHWPNRTPIIKAQIEKFLQITRGK